jgi:hypothetical protein
MAVLHNFKRRVKYNYLIANLGRHIAALQYKVGATEDSLQTLSNTAAHCATNYIGTYAWDVLENQIVAIAKNELSPLTIANNQPSVREKVLHVITEAVQVGGHTQLLINWIKSDTCRAHTVIFTAQKSSLPPKMELLKKEVPDVEFNSLDIMHTTLQRANQLRQLSLSYDCVILHHNGNDLVPMLAFACTGVPPVAIQIHADHVFWLGNAVADVGIEIRENVLEADKERRQIALLHLQPIPIFKKKPLDAIESKRMLGISEDHVMMLTIASEYKFKPNQHYNFFENIISVLNQVPNAVAYIVGVSTDSSFAQKYRHERIVFCGVLPNTELYEAACDVYVESYPIVSWTSLLQTVAREKPCQLMYAPVLLNVCYDKSNPYFQYPATKKEWNECLVKLLTDKPYRQQLAKQQSDYIENHNIIGGGWNKRLEDFYDKIFRIKHSFKTLKKSVWLYTDNEAALLANTGNQLNLSGIVITENILAKSVVKVMSVSLELFKRIFIGRQYRNDN